MLKRNLQLLFLLLFVSSSALSDTQSSTIAVSAVVAAACVVATTPIAFTGCSGISSTNTVQNSTLLVTCTTGTTYTIGLNAGQNASPANSVTNRRMADGNNHFLNYGLYQDANFTANWGNTPGTDTPAQATGTGLPQSYTIYGRIPGAQNVPAGTYSDVITVTVTY